MILASQDVIEKYTELGIYDRRTLVDIFKSHVKEFSEKVCIVDPPNKKDLTGYEPERLTYGELDRAVDAVADALYELGIRKDDVVMVQVPNCWELAMIYLAVGKLGAVTTPAPVLWREAELKHIAGLTHARLFITVEEFNGFGHVEMGRKLMEGNPSLKQVITLEGLREMAGGPVTGKSDGIDVDADDIFTICWTSGTEAGSKGCPLSHNNWKGMAAMQDSAGIVPGSVMLTAGPLVNMASIGTVYIPWIVNSGTMVLHHPFDPAGFMQQIMQEKPNYTLLVPAVANMIVKHPMVDSFDLSSFNTITLGSAPPSLWVMQQFKERWDVEIGNIWGQNEGTGFVSGVLDVPDMEARATSFPHFGKPGTTWNSSAGSFIEVKILDPLDEELTEPGDVGELVFKGPGMIAEYYRNPEVTKKSFTGDGFFRSGDLFQITEGNRIRFYERAKDIIIRGGYNISSQEVENYLLEHPAVTEAAVVGMPDEKLGERMCAYVVTADGEKVVLSDILSLLEDKGVAKYKFPERLEVVDVLPRNPVGKILKKNLRKDIQQKINAE